MLRTTLIFALISPCLLAATTHAEWATLKGRFLYGEPGADVPPVTRIKLQPGMRVCGNDPLLLESLVVHPKNRGIRDVVLWVSKPKRVHPDYDKLTQRVELDNENCRFEPHVALVPTSRGLRVKNSDKFGHSCALGFLKNHGVNLLIQPGKFVDIDLVKSEIIPVNASCGIHPWMNGIVLVQDHPYMAATDENGGFELNNLPSGDLTIICWHKKMGWIKQVKIDGKQAKWKRGRYHVELREDMEHEFVLDPSLFKKK